MSNPLEPEEKEKQRKLENNLFIYIDKPLQKKKKLKEEKQTDLFKGVEDENIN